MLTICYVSTKKDKAFDHKANLSKKSKPKLAIKLNSVAIFYPLTREALDLIIVAQNGAKRTTDVCNY